jgi:hypothetical protein
MGPNLGREWEACGSCAIERNVAGGSTKILSQTIFSSRTDHDQFWNSGRKRAIIGLGSSYQAGKTEPIAFPPLLMMGTVEK